MLIEGKVRLLVVGLSILLTLSIGIAYVLFLTSNIDVFPIIATLNIALIINYLKNQTGSFFSPASIFFMFYWLMLVGRPLIYGLHLTDQDLVSASEYNLNDVGLVNLIICMVLNLIGLFTVLIDFIILENFFIFPSFEIGHKGRALLLLIFFISGFMMLKDGIAGFKALSNSNYIELIENGELVAFSQLSYTLLKWTWFLLFIAYPKHSIIICLTFIVFLCALPMTGMRGYFIIYMLMVLVFLELRKKIKLKLKLLVPFIFILLTVTTLLLEYRLGFKVTDGSFFDPFFNAIFSQGATYEVVYGAFTFNDKVSFIQNAIFPSIFGNPPFGTNIDILRGINNGVDEIGFATSAIAELISGGPIIAILYSSILAFSLKILSIANNSISKGNGSYFVIFFLAPIIWGQPRGSIVQFIVKFGFLLAIFVIVRVLKIKKIAF